MASTCAPADMSVKTRGQQQGWIDDGDDDDFHHTKEPIPLGEWRHKQSLT